jgi:hypothetical protein
MHLPQMAFLLASSYSIAHFLLSFSWEFQLNPRAMVLLFAFPLNIGAFQLILALGSLFSPKIIT